MRSISSQGFPPVLTLFGSGSPSRGHAFVLLVGTGPIAGHRQSRPPPPFPSSPCDLITNRGQSAHCGRRVNAPRNCIAGRSPVWSPGADLALLPGSICPPLRAPRILLFSAGSFWRGCRLSRLQLRRLQGRILSGVDVGLTCSVILHVSRRSTLRFSCETGKSSALVLLSAPDPLCVESSCVWLGLP